MVSKDFFNNIEEVAADRGITAEELLEITAKAIAKSTEKQYGKSAKVEFRPEKNEIKVYTLEKVVEALTEVSEDQDEPEMTEILLEDAKKIKKSYKVGDIVQTEVNPKEFDRQTARSAKSTFGSEVKTLERQKAYEYFKNFEGEMINATIVDKTEKFYILELGQGVTTILPANEQLKNDLFGIGQNIKVYVKKVEQTSKNPKVVVSRADKNLITRLLELNIEEIKSGIVEIKGIARDPGDRCKIAIFSNDPKVDALGACVGEGGSRIKEVVNSLNGEKIDLYKWSDDPAELIANSLQPAHVTQVLNIDTIAKTSLAIVPDDQLSLAIGKNGQNVRLAVMSCGWKIDIKPTSVAYNEGLLDGLLYE